MDDGSEVEQTYMELTPQPAPVSLVVQKRLQVRNGYAITEGIDPHDGGLWDIRISLERIKAVGVRGMGAAKDLAYTLPHVLQHPTAIFQGVRDEGEKEWLCYCGIPPRTFHLLTGDARNAYPGEVYLVFVNADRVAYNSRWEKCDPSDSKLPFDFQGRFIRRWL